MGQYSQAAPVEGRGAAAAARARYEASLTAALARASGAADAAAGAPQPIPRPPRRSWSEVLASFMEQKNIRWGELVGGLLIVGCSVALVLSFWAEISQRPVLKFSIFTAVTGALFGLGLYTEHRWKLPTTSRGVLLIATLLVPLNFLAFAAFSRSAAAPGLVPIVGEASPSACSRGCSTWRRG